MTAPTRCSGGTHVTPPTATSCTCGDITRVTAPVPPADSELRDELVKALRPAVIGDWKAAEVLVNLVMPVFAAHLGQQQAADGAGLIASERRRQVEAEGWTPEHDAEHASEALAVAACCYALPPQMRKYRPTVLGNVPTLWPWGVRFWKPKPGDRVRELVKAGALIAPEIDRLRTALGADL